MFKRTYQEKAASAKASQKWWILDATDQPLGRVASRVATILRGKHKTTFTPHVDTGDFVIVVNAHQVKLTGNKSEAKKYYRHSGYPGAIKGKAYRDVIDRHPDLPLKEAVKGMLPKNVLGRKLIEKLKIYSGPEHPHKAQKPATLAP